MGSGTAAGERDVHARSQTRTGTGRKDSLQGIGLTCSYLNSIEYYSIMVFGGATLHLDRSRATELVEFCRFEETIRQHSCPQVRFREVQPTLPRTPFVDNL